MKNNTPRILYIGNVLSQWGYTPTNIETLSILLRNEGYSVTCVSNKKNSLLRMADMVLSVFKYKNKADVVLIDTYSTSAFYYSLLCSLLCRLLSIRYIPILHGGNLPERIKRSSFLSRQIFKHSYTNVVVSDYLKEVVDKQGWRALLIPNNINIEQYSFKLRSNIVPRILWVRSFHEIYNPQLAIEVLKLIKDSHPAAVLTMVGPDKDGSLEKCKELSSRLGLSDSVNFTGKLSKQDWIQLSESHDLFINTTNFDNLPVSVIEAMALGLPVITTNVGGLRFLGIDKHDMVLVPPKSKESFYDAFTMLINNPELVKNISINARKKAEEYDWSAIKCKWHSVLSSLNKTHDIF